MTHPKLIALFMVIVSACALPERPSDSLASSRNTVSKLAQEHNIGEKVHPSVASKTGNDTKPLGEIKVQGEVKTAEQMLQANIQAGMNPKAQFPTLSANSGGVINVRDFGAKGDGITDDTQAFKAAIERDEIANQGKIIYVPNGTYLVSDTITWPKGDHAGHYYKRTTLLGESRTGTMIKLKDNAPAFSDFQGEAVLDTRHNRANGFRNTIENLTLNTGLGNESVVGISLNSNNGGGIFNVSIISGDGQGLRGLDLTGVEIGPLLVKNVAVKGFDTGILVGGGKTNSVNMENITLIEQNQVGIDQTMQVLTINHLNSLNRVPAVLVRDHSATLALMNAQLDGMDNKSATALETRYREDGDSTPGERKTMNTFLFNVKQNRYQNTAKVYNCDTGDLETISQNIDEWSCGKPLVGMSPQTKTLRLPIKPTPYVSHDLNNIAVVKGNTGADIQAAIDTPGVKTVFLPNRKYQVSRPILIRGSVKKIIGMRAFFAESSRPIFKFEDGAEPLVSIERLEEASLQHNSKRSLVIKNSALQFYTNSPVGTGDLYLDDVLADSVSIQRQKVWARSLNVEGRPLSPTPKILNNGGLLWILGLKTEHPGTIIETKGKGSTEVLGGFIYVNQSIPDTQPPQAQYINIDSKMSILTRSYLPTATGYPIFVREIQNGISKDIINPNRRLVSRLFPYLGY
jgi:Pectate lyase superfamily protein